MNTSLLFGIALSAIATGAFASPSPRSGHAPVYHQQLAEGGSDRAQQNRVAEGGSDRVLQNRVAADGSDRLPQNQV